MAPGYPIAPGGWIRGVLGPKGAPNLAVEAGILSVRLSLMVQEGDDNRSSRIPVSTQWHRPGDGLSAPVPNCDRSIAVAAPTGAVHEAQHPRMILVTTVLASSLAFVDGSVVNVGLPAIARNFPQQTMNLSWVVSGYLLPLSALILIGGAAGDRFGHRRLLRAGVGLFLAASLLCALAPTLVVLLCGRVLQGIGAAMLMPTSLAILGVSFRGEARGRAIGTWAAAGAAAGAIGPLVGGWLIDIAGWRSMFLINLPIGTGALYFGARYVEDVPARVCLLYTSPSPRD